MSADRYLAFDIGGSKTAWGVLTSEGELKESGRYPTPRELEPFLAALEKVVGSHKVAAVGIGIAGTIRPDHRGTVLCTNLPALSDVDLAGILEERCQVSATVDNDARCALIGEVWKGSAQDLSSAVLITVGTGIGGAVMQRGRILPHPHDISREVSRIMVDPTDVFPARSGAGTVEAFIGGRSLEKRLSVDLGALARDVRAGKPEAKEAWSEISDFFLLSIRAIQTEYACKAIIVGGVGSKDLEYYLQDEPPCPVCAAKLGEQAALYGAARLAIDLKEDEWE